MSYVVLARKWRPQSFEDLVGQEHVATTIGNSIAIGRVAHAFLFTGVRGVGKTTSARILAKALNCEKGPTAKPCLACSPCLEIAAGSDLDVQEIDAASNTGVDDVRRLQETLSYRPARDRFKIYIVDEVHMLSGSAWNAFLKTLEEPPPHVKFIFATTEVTKVPVTILSRCQRYDFKLISAATIGARLRYVLDQEKVAAEDGAVSILAREAAGSMRDAISLLDQVIAWAGQENKLTTEGVAKVLGIAESAVLHALGSAVVDGDAARCLTIVGDLADAGYDMGHVTRDFLGHLRDLVVMRVAPDARKLLDVADEELADLKALATRSTVEDLTRLHQGFSRASEDILKSPVPRASLEMTLVRLARRPPLVPVDELVRRLADLESRLGGAATAAPKPNAPAQARAPEPRPAPVVRSSAGAAREPARPRPSTGPNEDDPDPQQQVGARQSLPTASPVVPPTAVDAPAPVPPAPPPVDARPVPPVSAPPSAGSARASSAIAPPRRSARAIDDPEDERFARFSEIVAAARASSPRFVSLLERAALVEVSSERLVLAYEPQSFEASQMVDAQARSTLLDLARAELGPEVTVEIVDLAPGPAPPTLARKHAEVQRARRAEADQGIRSHPMVEAAMRHLGAEVRDVRLPTDIDE